MESVCLTMRFLISDCELRIGFYSHLSSNPQSAIRNPQSEILSLLRSEKSFPARWLPPALWERRFLPFRLRHQLPTRHHARALLPAPRITPPDVWRAGQTRHKLPRV